MKKYLLTLWTALTLPMVMLAQDAQQVFIYSPGPGNGLHIARQAEGNRWQDMGQLCSSDYGTWGAEKKMYSPSLCRDTDGSWRLVFQVNSHSPVFAAAYSRDLVTWRPQDYPHTGTRYCQEPKVRALPATANGGGQWAFEVQYASEGHFYSVKASRDFRQFSGEERITTKELFLQPRVPLTIDGKQHTGQLFTLTKAEMDRVSEHFRLSDIDREKSNERMHNDGKNEMMKSLKDKQLKATLTVDMNSQKTISDKLIGIFFEDISYAADGGLYAELVQNRDFEYTSRDRGGWHATTAWQSPKTIRTDTRTPLHANNAHYALVTNDSLWNEGWDGISVEGGKKYDFSIFVRGKKHIVVQLIDEKGNALASATVKAGSANKWKQYHGVLTAQRTETKARLLLLPQGDNEVAIDMVSLFPQETFKNRKNGLRRDLAETIARLQPKFVRFPGGCMSHGQGLDNIYHWQHTVGQLWERVPDMNIWHYHQTRGLGFYEYFLFCEDIGAEPLPVLAAGVPCQNSANDASGFGGQQGGIPMSQMQAYIQELLDLIEWANGNPSKSKWAKMRADAGHPKPFNLKYIGIGNEDIISTVFEERYEMICKAIREKYPDIVICGTVGPFHTPSADYIEGWDFTKKHPDLQDMVDEHYYESTGWFMHHRNYYDNYDRSSAKVYLGEWAASTNVKRPNVETALAEALYLTDVERNADVVEMTSYAPMLCKDGHSNWNPDMIYFSNTTVRTTPAYEVQRLFSVNSGDRYISSVLSAGNGSSQASFDAVRHRLGASVVRNTKTGKTYVKLVNALPAELEVSVNGLTIPATARTEGFEGLPEEQQLNIKTGQAGTTIVLPPYSMRVITL